MTYTIELSDGRLIGAGPGEPALVSVKLTRAAFDGSEADPGGVCAAELSAAFFGLSLEAGEMLRLYRDGELLGTFRVSSATAAPGRLQVLAYDNITALDKDVSQWLASLTGWPYRLADFAQMVCAACDLQLRGSLENGEFPVAAFRAQSITGRQLMQWVCQAGCRFCRADPDGSLALCWVEESPVSLAPSGENFYFSGMKREDYRVSPAGGVHIGLTGDDVGVADGGSPLLSIRGNYLLCGASQREAAAIRAKLPPAYTPCRLETLTPLAPGQLFTVMDGEGSFTALAMTVEEWAGRFRITCTGSPSREDSLERYTGSYRALGGRVAQVQLGLEGLRTRMTQYDGDRERFSALSQDVDAIAAQVGDLEGETMSRLAQLELDGDGMALSVSRLAGQLEDKAESSQLRQLTEHFDFGADGLTISDSATGMSIRLSQEQVAFRDGTAITPQGMTTAALQVAGNLTLGDFILIPRSNGNLSLRSTGQG